MATLAMALTGAFTLRAQGQETKISPAPGGPAQVLEIRIGDEIEPVMAEYVVGGIEEAARIHASLILITMDTPGGLSTSMEDIIHHILDSPVPVAIFISPVGIARGFRGIFYFAFGGRRGHGSGNAHWRGLAASRHRRSSAAGG